MSKKLEQRTLPAATFRVRESSEEGVESRTIEGYAIRFNEESVVMADWDGCFREKIDPQACTKEFLDRQDIKLTMYHNREKILGRSKNGEGTLTYEVDEEGVLMRCELPRTALGDECLELVKRGDIQGMSFAYIDGQNAHSVTWEKGEDGVAVRTVHEMYGVYDMTLAADPAYPTTSVSQREAEDAILTEAEREAKRKAEEEKKREDEENERIDREAKEQRDRNLALLRLKYGY